MASGKAWTPEDMETLRAHVLAGKPFSETHAALPSRTFFSVRAKYLWLQVRIVDHDEEETGERESLAVKRDAAFQSAMNHAISLGLERPPVNVHHDNSDFRPQVFHPEPMSSGCSSALSEF